MFDVSFIVAVVVKAVRSHQGSMNYYCNQTREQKGGEKSQIFAEEKKRVEQLFFSLRLRHKMMCLDGGVFLYVFSPSQSFFPPQSRRFFLLSASHEVVEEDNNNPLSTLFATAARRLSDCPFVEKQKMMWMMKKGLKSSHKTLSLSYTKKAIAKRQLNVKALFFSSYSM